jgi:hypothetical protein
VKTVVLVAPHFLPSFLPSVHRARLWSYYLPEFGWKPIILTTDERYYECQTAPEMLDLLPDDLEIIRVRALPTKPIRLVGDISIRSLPFYYSAMAKLAREKKIDFIHFTVPAYSAALLGFDLSSIWRALRSGLYRSMGLRDAIKRSNLLKGLVVASVGKAG